MARKQTTEDLRSILFDCIREVKAKTMDASDAKAITALADKVIKTAKVELEYAETLSRLDKQDQGIVVGPVLLTQQNQGEEQ